MHLRRVNGRRGVQNKIEISMTPTALLQAASFQHTHEHYDFGEHWQPLLHTLYTVRILDYYKGTEFLKIVSRFFEACQFSMLLEICWNFQVVFFLIICEYQRRTELSISWLTFLGNGALNKCSLNAHKLTCWSNISKNVVCVCALNHARWIICRCIMNCVFYLHAYQFNDEQKNL